MFKPWRVITNIEPHFKVILSKWIILKSLFMHSGFGVIFPTFLYKKAKKTFRSTFKIGFISSRYKKGRLKFYSDIFRNQTILSLKKIEIRELKSQTIRWIKKINIMLPQFRVDLSVFNRKKGKLYFGDRHFIDPMILLIKSEVVRIIKSKNILWFTEINSVMPQFQVEFHTYIKKKE